LAKCIKNPASGVIKRVSESEALLYVNAGWVYVSKAEWKAFRDKIAEAPAKAGLSIRRAK
jgi:hypothetical protein